MITFSRSRKQSLKGNFFLFLISLSLILPINQNYSYLSVDAAKEKPHVYDFSVAVGPNNELFLTYRENMQDEDTISFIQTASGFEWNKTSTLLKNENDTFKIIGKPSIAFENNKILIVFAFQKNTFWGIDLFTKEYPTGNWKEEVIISGVNNTLVAPLIKYHSATASLWLTWSDFSEGSFNQYYIKTNESTIDWDNKSTLSEDNSVNCSDCDFIFDEEGTAHFIWSEGLENQNRVLYRYIFSNGTKSSIEYITDGTTDCEDPALVIDSAKFLNAFWTNRTVPNPEGFLGTINIQSSIRISNDNWSTPLKVGPFVPPDRPASGESDALNPAVVLDTHNQLWLAYEIIEEYAYHIGADIRNRIGNSWQPATYLSLYSNRVYDPLLIMDHSGNLHCFWIDSRHLSLEVYHRIKFENNVWSEEYLVTGTSTFFGTEAFVIVMVVIGGAVLLSIPVMILRRIRQRKAKRKVIELISGLRQ